MTEREALALVRRRIRACEESGKEGMLRAKEALTMAADALEKQIPKKVEWAIDNTWVIEAKLPVCPVCDCYLTKIGFIGKGSRTTWCDTCGQAIDWSEEE